MQLTALGARGARAAGLDLSFWLRGLVRTALTDYGIQDGAEVWRLRFHSTGNPAQRIKYATWPEAILDICGAALRRSMPGACSCSYPSPGTERKTQNL